MLSLHPAEEKFIYNFVITKRRYNFLKKKCIKVLVIKKKGSTFAPANSRRRHKIREQVHRHIGLTAYKNKSNIFFEYYKELNT
jgi:hypothetical protein